MWKGLKTFTVIDQISLISTFQKFLSIPHPAITNFSSLLPYFSIIVLAWFWPEHISGISFYSNTSLNEHKRIHFLKTEFERCCWTWLSWECYTEFYHLMKTDEIASVHRVTYLPSLQELKSCADVGHPVDPFELAALFAWLQGNKRGLSCRSRNEPIISALNRHWRLTRQLLLCWMQRFHKGIICRYCITY